MKKERGIIIAALIACSNAGIPIVTTETPSFSFNNPRKYLCSSADDLLKTRIFYDKKGKLLTNPGSKFHK